MKRLLSTGGAAGLLGLSRERIGQLIRDNRLHVAVRDSNGRALLHKGDVLALRAKREQAKGQAKD